MQRREFMKISALAGVAMAGVNLRADENLSGASTAKSVPNVKFNNGLSMPIIGLGTWNITGKDGQEAIETAFELGYRMIDSAQIYGNEEIVGAAFRASGLKQEEVFITTKVWRSDINYDGVKRALDDSLKRLKMDYVDLYLFHRHGGGETAKAWQGMSELVKSGVVKSGGVSNFDTDQTRELCEKFEIKPVINQIRLSPYEQEIAMQKELNKLGVITQSYSSFGGSGANILRDEILVNIAKKHGKTPAQIVIRWLIERGVVAIPKSLNKERQAQNLAVFDFKLDEQDRASIAGLDR